MRSVERSKYYLSRSNPFVPPDRRARIARFCIAHGISPATFRDDQATWNIWRFLKKRRAACEPAERLRVELAHRDLALAFELHHGNHRRLRPLLEAYLLAGADDASLAKKLALPKRAVRWFRRAFFDVEHLRKSPLRIIHDVIGITDSEGQSALSEHKVWKLVGYLLKVDALDRFFHDPNADGEALSSGGLNAWFARHTRMILGCKRLLATSNLSTDNAQHAEMLLRLLQQEQSSQRESDAAPSTPIERHVQAMLAEIPWTAGAAAAEVYEGTVVDKYDKMAAEVRDEELQILAAGETVPGLDEELASVEAALQPRAAEEHNADPDKKC